MAGAVDEILAVASVLDHAARGAIKLAHRQSRAHGGAAGLVGAAAGIVHLLLLGVHMAKEQCARHIAAIAPVQQAHVQNHAVAVLQAGIVVVVVRLRAVGAKAGDRREARARAALRLRVFQVGRFQLLLRHAPANLGDGRRQRAVVHAARFAHDGNLFRILEHTGVVHRRGAHRGRNVAPPLHQANGEVARPELVDAEPAGLYAVREDAHAIVRIAELHDGQLIVRKRKEAVRVEPEIAVRIEIERQHTLAGRNVVAGQVV